MFASLKKVFWTDVTVAQVDGGFQIRLDQRPLKTPEKSPLILPERGLADAVAAEWRAQTGEIDPTGMPFTRLANAAIDKMPEQTPAVIDILAAYGETDLVCHRATGPDALVAQQAAAWDPVMAWAAKEHDLRLIVTAGVIPVDQPRATLDRIAAFVGAHRSFSLMALHDLVMISGSFILAFAVAKRHLDAADVWPLSRIDEDWQAAQWGIDADAAAAAAAKREDFLRAAELYHFVRPDGAMTRNQ